MPSAPHPHELTCTLRWTGAAAGPTTGYRSYSRSLSIEIPGKPPLPASAAPPFLGDAAVHNPEDMLVAALSSCHCLSYLALAARGGVHVLDYRDSAYGVMEWGDRTYRFTKVILRPVVTVRHGTDAAKANALHEEAHATCFIARSVAFPVTNEPVLIEAEPGR